MRDKSRTLITSAMLPAAILGGLVLLFFNKMALSNLILARGDTFLYFYPYWYAAAAALREARLPFWNPAIFMGAPMLANSQTGFFYPLNWPFWFFLETPYAASAAILLHIFIAASGVYLVGRVVLSLSRTASIVAAISFALGGHLTAQVEHINQLQGLAWLPWFLLAVNLARAGTRRLWVLAVIATGALFALQLLAGHAQTTFITVVAVLIWILAAWLGHRFLNSMQPQEPVKRSMADQNPVLFSPFTALFAGGLLAIALASVQLLPTLELMRYSSRAGGLPANEVMSFSLPPHHLANALLPPLNQSLFSEYVAFLPLVILALALIGGWQWQKREGVLPALALAISGLFLALGAYNPFYWLAARLPGFSFFRAPARWLVLYALGLSFLAGIGWHLLWRWAAENNSAQARRKIWRDQVAPPLLLFIVILLLLIVWGFAVEYFIDLIPLGPEAPYERPSEWTVSKWVIEALLAGAFLLAAFFFDSARLRRIALWGLLVLGLLSAFLASRSLPYNNLTTPEAYFDLRPSTTRLLVESHTPPERMLSLSNIFFDPGDQAEIDTIYGDQLSDQALYDYIVAIKQKEINAPNLPMIYGLASIDGFDGGILPLSAYSQLTSVLMADGQETTDGRLREHLETVPEERWLDLFNARFLITDKTGDVWHDGIYYDRQHPVTLSAGETMSVSYLPDFEATEIRLLATAKPGAAALRTGDGDSWILEPNLVEDGYYKLDFPKPATIMELEIEACTQTVACSIEGLTLVDSREDVFQSLVPGNYRLIHSGDVKIYENSDLLPRAFMVNRWQVVRDSEEAIAALREPGFDVRSTAVIVADPLESIQDPGQIGPEQPGQARIKEYHPERVTLQTDSPSGGLLILTDAYYPGWSATIDGNPVSIYPTNALFRGIFVPPGSQEIVFQYHSNLYLIALIVFIFTLAIIAVVLAYLFLKSHSEL
jgi:hypothetical protein